MDCFQVRSSGIRHAIYSLNATNSQSRALTSNDEEEW